VRRRRVVTDQLSLFGSGEGAARSGGSSPAAAADPSDARSGRLAANVAHFARLLRKAGIPLGPGRVIDGLKALEVIDAADRAEFYWALHAVFVHRPEESEFFERAFALFWSEDTPGRVREDAPSPAAGTVTAAVDAVTESLREGRQEPLPPAEGIPWDTDGVFVPGYSSDERLRRKDFEQMSGEELAEARRVVSGIHFAVDPLPTRRFRADPHGPKVDLRATLRASIRSGGRGIPLQRRTRRRRPPPLIALCDISGSMRSYTRMLLHFLHALTEQRDRVHTFLFGTRLTNATPYLRRRDPDEAVRQLGEVVMDWDGGTRIGASLAEFNMEWSRRVLTRGAIVLLISDGLDQQGGEGLEAAMRRLHRSCRRLIWLNPLLRHEQFEPQAAGIRAMLPHVDDLRAIHNLKSFEKLAEALEDLGRPRQALAWRSGAALPGPRS